MGTGIVGSLRLALPALTAQLPASNRELAAAAAAYRGARRARDPIPAEFLLHTIGATMPADAVVVEEAPSHRPALQRHLPIRGYGQFHTMASGGLGYGIAGRRRRRAGEARSCARSASSATAR